MELSRNVNVCVFMVMFELNPSSLALMRKSERKKRKNDGTNKDMRVSVWALSRLDE